MRTDQATNRKGRNPHPLGRCPHRTALPNLITVHISRLRRALARLTGVVAIALVGSLALAGPAQGAVFVDETPERSWTVNGRVYAIEIVGDIVYVGGQFTTATSPTGSAFARRNLAAFRLGDGSLVTGWRADAGAVVRALDSDGSALWAGGFFRAVRGVQRRGLAKLDLSTGAVDTGFDARLNEAVRGIDVDGDTLYIGGHFTAASGQTHNRVAALDATTGQADAAFTASASNNVFGVRKDPVRPVLYVAGNFATMNGSNRPGLVGVSTTSGALAGDTLSGTTAPTYAVDVSDDGSRVFGGAGSNAVTSWRTSNGSRAWRHYAEGDIQALKLHEDTLYVGFHDGFQDDFTVKLLAAAADTGAIDPDFRPLMNQFWGVFGIDATSEGLAIGGDFTSIQGVAARGWTRFLP